MLKHLSILEGYCFEGLQVKLGCSLISCYFYSTMSNTNAIAIKLSLKMSTRKEQLITQSAWVARG